jgi:transcriptional regulator with XRE-family HTH domain
MITGEKAKAARSLLGWDERELAFKAGMSESAVRRFENGADPSSAHLRLAIRRALEFAGVEFPEGEPPRLKQAT